MRMYDLIYKKREGNELTDEEIAYFVKGYTDGSIPDYQAAALCMAIFYKGMNKRETATLTMEMANSGDTVDLSPIEGIKVDKHSTGGVGDKTSLIIGPIAASCGVKIAKMSGRGLGHTGGTVDKMESIPGMQTSLDKEAFFAAVNKAGIAVIGQSGNLCPADKKLYALRDVTATVDNVSLIASSIMSKKIAAGSDRILLDVKTGSGAFMKTTEDSINLAREMVEIGESVGRKTVALITDMDRPLGKNIGNALEIMEVIETLKGNGPEDLTYLCLKLASNMIYLGEKADTIEKAEEMAKSAIADGSALRKLRDMVEAQGGDPTYIDNPGKFVLSSCRYEVKAPTEGYIRKLNAESCGIAAVELGAGRETKESIIDFGAGIILEKNTGDFVKAGETLAVLYSESMDKCLKAEKTILAAMEIGAEAPAEHKIIHARVEM